MSLKDEIIMGIESLETLPSPEEVLMELLKRKLTVKLDKRRDWSSRDWLKVSILLDGVVITSSETRLE
jgi:hypothetical protein